MLDEATIKNVIDSDNTKDFVEYVWKDYKNIKLDDGYNLLQYAIYNSSVNIVEFLLDSGYYDIDYQSKETNDTALIIAMNDFTNEAVDSVHMIFKYYPDVNVDLYNNDNKNAVGAGIYSGIEGGLVTKCAEKISNYDLKDNEGDTIITKCLYNAALYRMHAIIIEIYINNGATVTRDNIINMLTYIGEHYKRSIVWKALQKRNDLQEMIMAVAIEKGMNDFLPEEVQDIFIF